MTKKKRRTAPKSISAAKKRKNAGKVSKARKKARAITAGAEKKYIGKPTVAYVQGQANALKMTKPAFRKDAKWHRKLELLRTNIDKMTGKNRRSAENIFESILGGKI